MVQGTNKHAILWGRPEDKAPSLGLLLYDRLSTQELDLSCVALGTFAGWRSGHRQERSQNSLNHGEWGKSYYITTSEVYWEGGWDAAQIHTNATCFSFQRKVCKYSFIFLFIF